MRPVGDYLEMQGRFAPVRDDPGLLERVQRDVDERWDELQRLHADAHATV